MIFPCMIHPSVVVGDSGKKFIDFVEASVEARQTLMRVIDAVSKVENLDSKGVGRSHK